MTLEIGKLEVRRYKIVSHKFGSLLSKSSDDILSICSSMNPAAFLLAKPAFLRVSL